MEKFQGKIEGNILFGPKVPDFLDEDLVKASYAALIEAGDRILLTNAATRETKTAKQILQQTASLVENLREKFGIGVGDVVAVCSENSININIVYLAVWILGAVLGPINPIYTAEEMKHIFSITKPKIVICGEKYLERVADIRHCIPSITALINYDGVEFNQLLDSVDCKVEWRVPIPLQSTASLFSSSGTTGLPKCVELSFINMQRTSLTMLYIHDNYDHQVSAGFLPQYHGFGMIVVMDALLRKTNLIVFPRFEIMLFLESCERYKIQSMCVVPPVVVLLSKHPQVEKTDLSALREIRSGAAPIKPSTAQEVLRRAGKNAKFYEGYGLTETTFLAANVPTTVEAPPGSVGIVVPGLQCKVADINTGETLGPNEDGELCFKGDSIMKGYKDNPEATAATYDSDGWFHSGDVGYFDEQGWVFVRERIKEIIKYNAQQVSPSELEALILRHPSVMDVAVWGKPDEYAGELPMAFVVPEANSDVKEEDIQKFVAENVSPHKKLRGGVVFVKEIPKTLSGKILRRKLPTLLPGQPILSTP